MVYIQGMFSKGQVYRPVHRSEYYLCLGKNHDVSRDARSVYTGFTTDFVELIFDRSEPMDIDTIAFGKTYLRNRIFLSTSTWPFSEYTYLTSKGAPTEIQLSALNDVMFPVDGDMLVPRYYAGQNGTKLRGDAATPKQSKRIRPTGDIDI